MKRNILGIIFMLITLLNFMIGGKHMKKMRKLLVLFFVLVVVTSKASTALAITYDLTNDWSNISNPNGVWSLNEGNNPLPFLTDYLPAIAGDQNAWAAAAFPDIGHVPVWAKADVGFST